jgi:ribosomal-protein-alanine N-acetyltransferase
MTPSIPTERLVLRPLSKVTARQVAWLNDPEVVRFSEQRHREHTMFSQINFINSFNDNSHLWGIHRIDTNEHIGNLSADHDPPNNVADVGIMVGETRHWGQGYATEAWRGACTWLLDKEGGGMRKLEAGCMRANEAMVRIIRGSGFAQEGERANHFWLGGGPVGMVLFGRFR